MKAKVSNRLAVKTHYEVQKGQNQLGASKKVDKGQKTEQAQNNIRPVNL